MDFEEEVFKPFLGQWVVIGTPNFINPYKLFLEDGIVVAVEEGHVALKLKKGYRKIPYGDILSIRIKGPVETFEEEWREANDNDQK